MSFATLAVEQCVAQSTVAREDSEVRPAGTQLQDPQREGYPNFVVEIPARFVESLGGETITEEFDIEDVINGSRVRGSGQLEADTSLAFAESDDRIAIKVAVRGTTQSQSIGYQDQVSVRTRGDLRFSSASAIIFNEQGLSALPFKTNVALTNTIESINSPYRLPVRRRRAEQAVWNRHESDRLQAERHAVRDLNASFNDRVEEKIAAVRDAWQNDVLVPLREQGIEPRIAVMETRADVALMALLIAGDQQLGAPRPLSGRGSESALRVGIHESVLNNTLTVHANRTMPLTEAIATALGDLTSTDAYHGDDQVTVTLADENPLRISFEDGCMRLAISGRQYQHMGQRYGPMDVEISFRVSPSSNDGLSLVREEPQVLAPIGPDGNRVRMGVRGYSLRRILNNALERRLPVSVASSDIKLPAPFDTIDDLETTHMSIADGWLDWQVLPARSDRLANNPDR